MKKPLLQTIVFSLLVVAIAGITCFSFINSSSVSLRENRALASMPELNRANWFSGEFASGMESFLSDHVFARDEIIDAVQTLENITAKEMEIQVVAVSAAVDDGGSAPQAAQERKGSSAAPEASDPGSAVQNGTVSAPDSAFGDEPVGERVILNDRIVGTFVYSSEDVDEYARAASRFFDMFPDYFTKVLLLVPGRISFEEQEIAELSDSELPAIEQAYSQMDPTVIPVDVYAALEKHSARVDDLYYRTDHHWTQFASYLAAEKMFSTLGKSFQTIDRYNKITGKPFLGYLYAQNHSESIKKQPDELIYYLSSEHDIPKVSCFSYSDSGELKKEVVPLIDESRQGYYTFSPGGTEWSVIEGNNPEGSSVILVGDSYCNVLAYWIAENSSSVLVIDPRDFPDGRKGLMSLVEEYGVEEVVVCDYTSVLDSPWFIGLLEDLTE